MTSTTTNTELIDALRTLTMRGAEEKAAVWGAIAEKLKKSNRSRVSLNLSRINRCTEDDETVAVPGKVLASGSLNHRVRVAAFSFSRRAREKIEEAGGECMSLRDLAREKPKGSRVKIIG